MNLYHEVITAENRIRPWILRTPVEYSPWLSQKTGARVWLKMEHLQITGSFKLRGAANKILSLSSEEKNRGVITASTGNHGSALAYIASQTDCKATIYLPETVAKNKVEMMQLYGGELVFRGQDSVETENYARAMAEALGLLFVSPYNDPQIIGGQGTLGIELTEQVPDMDAVLVPVGGGGLISGIAGYLKTVSPSVKVVGCQPKNSAVMYESVLAGKILDIPSLPTLSDGTAGGLESGSITFDLCRQYVDDYQLVSEKEIGQSLRFLLEKHYLLVEGAAALSVASLLQAPERYKGKTVVLILCGRKMGLDILKKILNED
ncbi:MAG: threonine/serine dehydratase [Bacteroidia bacterium]|nr:threonine/serine dehydratase [Bacteroidia bacterium]